MDTPITWYDLTPDHGALEIPEQASGGIGLELHVVICTDGTGTFAWWQSDRGGWLGVAEVGRG